jgi:hypothetical protein
MKRIDVTWKLQDYLDLDYQPLGGYGSRDFAAYHHYPYKHLINNDMYGIPNPMPKFVSGVLDNFKYGIKTISFCRMPPGNILPLHRDRYTAFIESHDIRDVDAIHRYIVFLEHSKLGHLLQIEDRVYAVWRPGDYIGWQGTTVHAAYNLGTEHRYTMQVTCFGAQ